MLTSGESVSPDVILLKALTTWANLHLSDVHGPNYQCTTENIVERVYSGPALIQLVNALHGTPMPLFAESPVTQEERLHNAELALSMLAEYRLPPAVLDASRIASGEKSYIVELLWQMAVQFQIREIAHGGATGEEALLLWCKDNLPQTTSVPDLSESWRDGRQYCLLIAEFRPALIDKKDVMGMSAAEALREAFECAEEHLDLPPLLDEEDITSLTGPATESERRAVTLLLSEFFHLFSGNEQIEAEELAPSSSVEPGGAPSLVWARPKVIAGREDVLVEWESSKAPLYHLETRVDNEVCPAVRLEFARFMEEMLVHPWPVGKFAKLRVHEANSYEVREDKLTRIVFISEEREAGLVALVGFSSEEHGARAGPSERNRTYLQYLANSCLERPECRRRSPTVAEAALVCYARWLELTYRSSYLHIWVDPPDSTYPEYIFRNSSKNLSVSYIDRDKVAERQKLMQTYQRIFEEWDLQSYVWRPEIPLPPAFAKDLKSEYMVEDGMNVRRELDVLVQTARLLSQRLNKYFEERTLVVYLSEVTVLARDPTDPARLLAQKEGEAEYTVEVEVEDETLLCPTPIPERLLSWGLIHNPDLSFDKHDDYVTSTARILKLFEDFMHSSGELMCRYDHVRAAGIVEAPDD